MSTAGKVLVVLVMLSTLGWIILSAGVSQLNTNGNKKLDDLVKQVAKLQVDLKQAQDDIVSLRDETSSVQENIDRQVTMLRARQSDLEKARSQIRESLSRNDYQLEIVKETIDKSNAALQHRIEEQQADGLAVEKSKGEVKELMAKTSDLLNQLLALRKEFQSKYHANVGSLGATH